MSRASQASMRLPAVARDFVSTVFGFGVAVSLFLAPFLGAKRIPGFEPLIAIFPEQHGKLLIPVSSLLIGVVALAVQFFAGEAVARRSIRRVFIALLLIVVAGLLTLLIVYSGFVYIWDEPDGTAEVVITGWSRLPGCGCPGGNTRQCIEGLAFVDLGSCWSDASIFGVQISLFLSYLVSIEGFAGLAGLYVLQRVKARELEKKEKRVAPVKAPKLAGRGRPRAQNVAPEDSERSSEGS